MSYSEEGERMCLVALLFNNQLFHNFYIRYKTRLSFGA